jgi:FkbM family methyltransferase
VWRDEADAARLLVVRERESAEDALRQANEDLRQANEALRQADLERAIVDKARWKAVRELEEVEAARWQAIREREEAEAARWQAIHEREEAEQTRGQTVHEKNATIRHAVTNMDGQGFVRVALNGQDLWLPPATIRTMTHCFHMEDSGRFIILIERAQLDWLAAHLRPGSHFIDVGAATGAICLPLARQFGSSLRITAFEPAVAARDLLAATIRRNDLGWIKILPIACSDQAGHSTFYEFPQDEGDVTPFLPEASTLVATTDSRARAVPIELTTLDAQFGADDAVQHAAIKIDVEGFEAKVLVGGRQFLARVRPALAIDIHANPFGEGTTEGDVRQFLEPLGYRFEKLGHVLACNVSD